MDMETELEDEYNLGSSRRGSRYRGLVRRSSSIRGARSGGGEGGRLTTHSPMRRRRRKKKSMHMPAIFRHSSIKASAPKQTTSWIPPQRIDKLIAKRRAKAGYVGRNIVNWRVNGINAFDLGNAFDNLDNLGDNYELDGLIFKKIRKAVKKIRKKVKKIGKKLDKKVLRKVYKSDIGKVALGVAGIMYGGPLVAGLIKKVGAQKIISKGISKVAAMAAPSGNSVEQDVRQQAEGAGQAAEQIGSSPEFQQIAQALASRGLNKQQIAQEWGNSETFRAAAIPKVAQAVYPMLHNNYMAAGASPNYAQQQASAASYVEAEKAVNKITIDHKTLLIGGGLLATILLLLRSR